MIHPSQDYTTQDLLAFYDRVKPVLSTWLAKSVWTARETAMLCAGYVPCDAPEWEKSELSYQPESIQGAEPIDQHQFLPPHCKQCTIYLMLLNGTAAAAPRKMVQLLSPTNRKSRLIKGANGQSTLLEMQRSFSLDVLRELQWFFIIANAVGLQVPALVPFGLLDKLSNRSSVQRLSDSVAEDANDHPEANSAQIGIDKNERPVLANLNLEAKQKATQRMSRERQPLQMTPDKRGYHTTEEVGGLTNLLSDTLNKYAREGKPVEGFTPFKRHNGRSWQWRDDQQQAEYEATITANQPKRKFK